MLLKSEILWSHESWNKIYKSRLDFSSSKIFSYDLKRIAVSTTAELLLIIQLIMQ